MLLAAGVNAESMEDAKAAFAEGRFADAAVIAEAAGTSEGYALAARSLAVYGHYAAPEEEKKELFERALQLGGGSGARRYGRTPRGTSSPATPSAATRRASAP